MRRIFTTIIAVIGLTVAAHAADAPKSEPAEKENFFKRAGRVFGHDAKAAER